MATRPFNILVVLLALMATGSVINTIQPAIIVLSLLLLALIAAMLLYKGTVAPVTMRKMGVVLLVLIVLFLVKLLFAFLVYDKAAITNFGIRLFVTCVIALLVVVYFSDNKSKFIGSLRSGLVIIMTHAFFSFAAWFFVGNTLQEYPAEHVNLRTFYYLLYYPGYAWDGSIYYVNLFGVQFPRIQGVFWEPGILQFYMNVLLFISLFVVRNRALSFLAVIAVLITWSTTGYVLMGVIVGYWLYENRRHMKYFLLSIVALPFVISIALYNITDKLYGEKAGSSYARVLDALASMNIISDNPIIGLPLDYSYMQSALSDFSVVVSMEGYNPGTEAAVTNSIAAYAVFFGVPGLFFIVLLLYRQTLFAEYRVLFFILAFVTLLSEPLGFFVFFVMLIISGYVHISQRVTSVRLS